MGSANREGYRPGLVDLRAGTSEHNLRNLYRRWAEFIEADSWEALASWRRTAAPQAAEGG